MVFKIVRSDEPTDARGFYGVGGRLLAIAVAAALHSGCPHPLSLTPFIWNG